MRSGWRLRGSRWAGAGAGRSRRDVPGQSLTIPSCVEKDRRRREIAPRQKPPRSGRRNAERKPNFTTPRGAGTGAAAAGPRCVLPTGVGEGRLAVAARETRMRGAGSMARAAFGGDANKCVCVTPHAGKVRAGECLHGQTSWRAPKSELKVLI